MEALYRKYRPTTFSDVVGQEHIERTLKNAIEQNKVSHAYLFCGPRGTGKTTMARILAKALLCEKGPTVNPDGTCPECEAIAQGDHPDVYELDAASRTGVENVREEIISRVNYAPTRGSSKVYIIDEVHMLSTAAFNALLKTLEEPPAHVVFILCTTDPQKVPETIHSRCQRFDFHRISNESIVSRLGAVCVEEGVEFEGEALDLIAYRAEGGMRNALTSLEQLIAFGGGAVTLAGAQNLLGSLDQTDLSEIIAAIGTRNAAACFNWIARYCETGADLAQFVRDLAEHVRNLYLLSMAGSEVELQVSDASRTAMTAELKYFGQERLSRMLSVLGDLMKELRSSSNPRLSFEIALTRMIRPDSDLTLEALAERVERLEAALKGGAVSFASAPAASPVSVASQAPARQSAPMAQAAAAVTSNQSPVVAPAPTAAPAPAAAPTVQRVRQAQPVEPHPPVASAAEAPAPAAPVPVSAQPASAPVASAPSAPAPASPVVGAAFSASVDLSNPAALQRMWHSVTSTLRKTNPARGVLFMNAKVSAEPNDQGIVVEFAKDNGFAYTAAQKPEVCELLSQTLAQVAGGTVPFRLAIAGGAAPAQASAPSPDVRTAAARAGAQHASSAPQRSAEPAMNVPAPAAPAAPSVPSAVSASVAAPATAAPAATKIANAPVVAPAPAPVAPTPAYDEDSVPLDLYDAYAPEEAVPFEGPSDQPVFAAPAQGSAPAYQNQPPVHPRAQQAQPVQPAAPSQNAPNAAAQAAQAAAQRARAAVAARQAETGEPSGQPAGEPAPVSSSGSVAQEIVPGENEAEQIKEILTASFGAGIKFEELPN